MAVLAQPDLQCIINSEQDDMPIGPKNVFTIRCISILSQTFANGTIDNNKKALQRRIMGKLKFSLF
jgi:hypothetical protein